MAKTVLTFKSPKIHTQKNLTSKKGIYSFYPEIKEPNFVPVLNMFKETLTFYSGLSLEFVSSCSPDHLTDSEIADIEASWREIQAGLSKKFESVDELLAELKR